MPRGRQGSWLGPRVEGPGKKTEQQAMTPGEGCMGMWRCEGRRPAGRGRGKEEEAASRGGRVSQIVRDSTQIVRGPARGAVSGRRSRACVAGGPRLRGREEEGMERGPGRVAGDARRRGDACRTCVQKTHVENTSHRCAPKMRAEDACRAWEGVCDPSRPEFAALKEGDVGEERFSLGR